MNKTQRLNNAEPNIIEEFEAASQRIYNPIELRSILVANRDRWDLPRRITTSDVIAFLTKRGRLRVHVFTSKQYPKQKTTRYSWGEATPYEVSLRLRPRAYLSHATAAELLGLLKKRDKTTIYVNSEQSEKAPSYGEMTQTSITMAFANKPHSTRLIYNYGRLTVIPVNGKQSNRYGVKTITSTAGEILDITNVERTLVDMVVRPIYSGGAGAILKAFRTARSRVSEDNILGTLQTLKHRYPYHQTIGFMMERAGYSPAAYNRFRDLGLDTDFYVENQMKNPAFSKEWRLFYPADL